MKSLTLDSVIEDIGPRLKMGMAGVLLIMVFLVVDMLSRGNTLESVISLGFLVMFALIAVSMFLVVFFSSFFKKLWEYFMTKESASALRFNPVEFSEPERAPAPEFKGKKTELVGGVLALSPEEKNREGTLTADVIIRECVSGTLGLVRGEFRLKVNRGGDFDMYYLREPEAVYSVKFRREKEGGSRSSAGLVSGIFSDALKDPREFVRPHYAVISLYFTSKNPELLETELQKRYKRGHELQFSELEPYYVFGERAVVQEESDPRPEHVSGRITYLRLFYLDLKQKGLAD